MRNNRVATFIFRLAAFILSFSVLLNHLGIFEGHFNGDLLFYYTNQSNVLAVFYFGLVTIRTGLSLRESKTGPTDFYPRFGMVIAVDLFLTFIVYWALLAPTSFTMDGNTDIFTFTNIVLHGVTPLLCLADYFLFTQPHQLKQRDVYAVTIFPILYVGFATIVGFAGHVFSISPVDHKPVRFAYFFFDYDRIGWMAIPYIFAVMVFLVGLGYILYFIDKRRKVATTK